MGKEKKAIEIELLHVDISGFTAPSESKHIVTCELIWPRLLVASKTSLRTLKMHKGMADLQNSRWMDRILFKENVEYTFGLVIRVSQSLTSALFDEIMRYIGGAAFGVAGSLLESEVGKEAGDLAASPLLFVRKKLLASHEAEILLEGGTDLETAALDGETILEIPLLSLKNQYETRMTTGGRGRPTTRKRITAIGDRRGTATIRIKTLQS